MKPLSAPMYFQKSNQPGFQATLRVETSCNVSECLQVGLDRLDIKMLAHEVSQLKLPLALAS